MGMYKQMLIQYEEHEAMQGRYDTDTDEAQAWIDDVARQQHERFEQWLDEQARDAEQRAAEREQQQADAAAYAEWSAEAA